MPHTPSAKKRLRQTAKRRLRNRSTKKAIRVQIKKLDDLVKQGPADQVQAELKQAIKKLDKAAARGIIHRNTAARKKSQLARLTRVQAPAAAGAS
jgi:small subunit ribosomal protein S20